MSALSPLEVAARLARLREIAVIERDEEARARLAREQPAPLESFEAGVERRLRELRALCELANHLHRGVPAPSPATPPKQP